MGKFTDAGRDVHSGSILLSWVFPIGENYSKTMFYLKFLFVKQIQCIIFYINSNKVGTWVMGGPLNLKDLHYCAVLHDFEIII